MTMETTTPETTTTWQDAAAASAEAQAEPPARKTVRRLVKSRLSDAAAHELAKHAAQAQRERKALVTERKAANAAFRSQLEELDQQLEAFAEAIASGTATEELDVYERFDPDTGRTELVGLDGMVYEPAADVPADKRQLTLAEAKGNGHADEEDGDDLGLSDDDESPDLEDRLDRALAEADADPADACLDGDEPSAPALEGVRFDESWKHAVDPADEPAAGDVVITEPEALLAGASEEVTAAPKRRGRGKR